MRALRQPLRETRLWLLALVLLSLATTFAQPRLAAERAAFRYLAVFDITQSMNVRDAGAAGEPAASRLEFARGALAEVLAGLPCGNELGLGIFTQHRSLVLLAPVEVCEHYNELTEVIAKIDWRMAWDARSEVAKGLYNGVRVAAALGPRTALVFFSDGHEAPPVHPDYRPRFSGEPGAVRGLVVGVGGTQPAPIPKYRPDGTLEGYWQAAEVLQVDTYSLGRDGRAGEQLVGVEAGDVARRIAAGTEHLSALREDYLLRTAQPIGLAYHRLRDAPGLHEALLDPRLGTPRVVPVDVRWALCLLALLLLLLASLPRLPRRTSRPPAAAAAALNRNAGSRTA